MTDVTRRAEHAQRIMSDELVVEAFDIMEREVKEVWATSAESESDGRERCYRMLWSMRRFKAFFQGVIEDGVMHEHKLQALKRGTL